MKGKKLITRKQAAEMLNVSTKTIDNYATIGYLTKFSPSGQRARAVRFDETEILNFYKKQK